MYEIKVNTAWVDLKTKDIAALLGIPKKKMDKSFSGLEDWLSEVRKVARPFVYRHKKGALVWDGFEDEQLIFFVNSKTGKRTGVFSTSDPAEAKAKWKKLVRKQRSAESK